MITRILFMFVFFMVLPLVAIAQAIGVEPEASVSIWDKLGGWISLGIPWLVTICAGLSTIFPSVGKIMKIVDIFAGNWGRARNDAGVQ